MTDCDDSFEDDVILTRLQALLNEEEQIKATRAEMNYDGVLGLPPDWVDEWHQNNFIRIRNNLLDNSMNGERVLPEQIANWIKQYCAQWITVDGIDPADIYIPEQILGDIGYLAHLRYCVGLGKCKGLKELGGRLAMVGDKVIEGGKKGQLNSSSAIRAESKQRKITLAQAEVDKIFAVNSTLKISAYRRQAAKNLNNQTKILSGLRDLFSGRQATSEMPWKVEWFRDNDIRPTKS